MTGENLYCPEQRGVTNAYRDNYDLIEWGNDDDDELAEDEQERG